MRRFSQTGFSLVEFLLVVVLISILAAIIVPRLDYKHITRQEVYAVAHTVAKDLRKTRRYAIGQGERGTMGLTTHTTSPTLRTYRLEITSATSWKIVEDNAGVPTDLITQTLRNSEVQVATVGDVFEFNSLGTPVNPVAGGAIQVKDYKDRYQWNVSVIKNTGRVTLTRVK